MKLYLIIILTGFLSVLHSQSLRVISDGGNETVIKSATTEKNETKSTGFFKGKSFYSFLFGPGIIGGGSYIKHEKLYDKRLQDRIVSGQIKTELYGFPAVYQQPNYQMGGYFSLQYQYAVTNYIGLGAALSTTNIYARRQDIFQPLAAIGNNVLEPVRERNIYSDGSAQFTSTFHALPFHKFDPYLAVLAGITMFKGEAHEEIENNKNKIQKDISNGRGWSYGAAIGTNIHLDNEYVLIFELGYQRRLLKSDQFSYRTLELFFFQIGMSHAL